MLDGLLGLSLWGYVAAALIVTHITIASVTIFLHRHQAHRALELHPLVSHFFRFWLWLTTGMRTKAWVAIHRKHHAKCETPADPHSPQVLGIKKVLWQGAELYRLAAQDSDTLEKYGRGTPDDWLERHVYRHSLAGVALMALLDFALFGAAGITIWAVQMVWIPFWAAGVINGVGHYWGYRNYECADAATNIVPWGILIGGEELHNNHHSYAASAKLSSKWWEFDIGWAYIRVLETLGLAHVKKRAPRLVIGPAKSAVDMDTLRAVLGNRLAVMARFVRQVLLPVWRSERERAGAAGRRVFREMRRLLVRNDALLAPADKQTLAGALAGSGALGLVYDYKQKLQEIWERSAAHPQRPLEALQQWCREAEATGIDALKVFAQRLRGYTQPAM
jgi:stearoyl-CoA desaturase (delta-9 desaturase)